MLFAALLSSDGNSNCKAGAISDPYLGSSRCRCLFAKESVDAFSYNIGGSSGLGVWATWPAGLENVSQLVRGCKMKKSVSAVPTQDDPVTTEHLLPSGTFHKSTSHTVGSYQSLLRQYSFSSLPASFRVALYLLWNIWTWNSSHTEGSTDGPNRSHSECGPFPPLLSHAGRFCPPPTWRGLADTYSPDSCNQLDQLPWFI